MSITSSVVPVVAAVMVAGASVTGARSMAVPSPVAGVARSTAAPAAVAPAVGPAPAERSAAADDGVGWRAGVERAAGGRAAVGRDSVGGGAVGASQDGLVAAAPRAAWQWPLSPRPRVARPYVAPRSTWGAGHRGVDLASASGQPVRAVAAGTVTHVGVIAGRPTVTVTHPGGLRSTYEPVDAAVRPGDTVVAGQVLGRLVVAGSHCSPTACLHLGALRGRDYLDPMTLLGPGRVRLLPLWRAGP